jgi:hypothetical protein
MLETTTDVTAAAPRHRYDPAGPLDAEEFAAAISTVVFDGLHAESSACVC